MVLGDIKLEEQYECSVPTTIMLIQWVLMAWDHKAGCKLKSSNACTKESKNKIDKLVIRWILIET